MYCLRGGGGGGVLLIPEVPMTVDLHVLCAQFGELKPQAAGPLILRGGG